MAAAELSLLFALMAALVGLDLARIYPMTAAGVFLAGIHAAFVGGLQVMGVEIGTSGWWLSALIIPVSFWLMGLELIRRARRDLTIHVGLFAFHGFWFATAVYILWTSGGQPSLALALGLGITYGAPIEVGLWAAGQAELAGGQARRWQGLAVALLAGVLLAVLAVGTATMFPAAFLLLAGIWMLVRYGGALDESAHEGAADPVPDPHAWIEEGY